MKKSVVNCQKPVLFVTKRKTKVRARRVASVHMYRTGDGEQARVMLPDVQTKSDMCYDMCKQRVNTNNVTSHRK